MAECPKACIDRARPTKRSGRVLASARSRIRHDRAALFREASGDGAE